MLQEKVQNPKLHSNLIVEEVSNQLEWQKLREPWLQFLRDSQICDPFLTYEWFDCCVQWSKDKKKLMVLVVKEDSRIIGIAPFCYFQDTVRYVPVTRISFIASPDTAHVDIVVSNQYREIVLNEIVNYLFSGRGVTWDVLKLKQWPSESSNCRAFREALIRKQVRFKANTDSQTPFIQLNEPWDQFLSRRSVRFRKTRRNIVNKLSKLNKVEIECVRMDPDGKWLKEVSHVSERGWKHPKGLAMASTNRVREFFETLTQVAGEKGWLLIWVLKVNDVSVAMEYDLVANGQVYALRADFDESFSEYSPGTYLETEILRRLFEDSQYEVYYTGPGLNEYKLQWTQNFKENIEFHIFNDTVKGKMLSNFETQLIPIFKYFRSFF